MKQGLQMGLLLSVLSLAQAGVVRAQDLPAAVAFETGPAALGAAEPSANPETDAMRSAYVLGPDDEITVRTLEAEEISAEALRVDLGGFVSLPLIGRVRAAGRTLEQLEAELVERLRFYVREPRVAVGISHFRSQPVSVIGAVNKPGVHQLEGRKTLIEMLSLAGGLREDAGHEVKITRRIEWGVIPLAGAESDPSGQFSTAEVNLQAVMEASNPAEMGYLVDSSSHYILGVGVPALVASTIVL